MSFIGTKRRTGSFSRPQRKVLYALRNRSGHYLAQIERPNAPSWVTDPNEAFLWAHADACESKAFSLNQLGFMGELHSVEITFVLNSAADSYDWHDDDAYLRHAA